MVTNKERDMYKRAFVIAAALCAAATMTVGTIASASGDEGRKVNFVDTEAITSVAQFSAAYAPDFSRCTFNSVGNVDLPCVVPVAPVFEPSPGAYNETLTGDFQGTLRFKGSAVLGAANDLAPATLDFAYEGYQPFSGQVEGCGKGTFILHKAGNLNSTSGTWQIVPGSGRGDLTGISGSGTYSAPAPFTPSNDVGHVRCAKHDE
jgi:hypothetical protein